ncbi:hypothetical protein BDW72DRAFT_174897 [Aspergillus terricola var. indicus]
MVAHPPHGPLPPRTGCPEPETTAGGPITFFFSFLFFFIFYFLFLFLMNRDSKQSRSRSALHYYEGSGIWAAWSRGPGRQRMGRL